MSNGNVKLVDNAKDWQGKHRGFTPLQDEPIDYLQTTSVKTREAFDLWVFLKRRSDSEYNATINNIARDLHMGTAKVRQAQELLINVGLLKIEEEAELTGEKRIVTGKGITVKNNKAQYTVYATSDKIIALMSKQTAVVEEVPKAQEVQAEAVKVVARPAAVSPSHNELIKAREDEIKAIGMQYGLLSQAQLTALVDAVKAFAITAKRKANNAEIKLMANYLDAGVNAETKKALNSYIERQALHK